MYINTFKYNHTCQYNVTIYRKTGENHVQSNAS